MEAAQQKQKIVGTLKQTLSVAEAMNGIAIETNANLHSNGQKLKKIDHTLNMINGTMDQAQNSAKQITSYWYYLKNKVKRTFGFSKKTHYTTQEQSEKQTPKVNNQKLKETTIPKYENNNQSNNQQDELTSQLITKLRQIKGHCKEMGNELDRQAPLITKIDGKMDRANNKIQQVNMVIKKQLRK